MKKRLLISFVLILLLFTGCAPTPAPVLAPTVTPITLPTQTENIVPPTETLPPAATDAPTPTTPPTLIPTEEPPAGPPSIILFIGDGMGAVHRQAATWLGSGEGGLLVMDNMPIHGLASTTPADREITDSGAAGTAISTGVQTNYQAVGVDPSDQTLTTILEQAQEKGWSVGLVSTVMLADATPAVFAAHVPNRTDKTGIARQMMAHNIDVLLGGGEDDFFSSGQEGCYPGRGKQPKAENLVAAAVENGYTYVCTREELLNQNLDETDHLLGLFGGEELLKPDAPTLAEMTQTAIQILSRNPNGFFLMVEGGQIDWASHENDAQNAMLNALALDAAVTQAKIYTLSNPNTLIIVAADHETGGMRLNQDGEGSYLQDGPFNMPDGTPFWVDWSTGGHTGDPIPVTAEGPYAELLAGEYHLTQIYQTMYVMLFAEDGE